jgi:sugar-specific transcriptional regulator TrmB
LSGVKRPTTYLILDQLVSKGYVNKYSKGNANYFQPVDPKLILEEQKRKIDGIEKLIPQLEKLSYFEDCKIEPKVSFYEGKTGLIRIMEDTLTVKDKRICCWANAASATQNSLQSYYPTYIKQKVRRKVHVEAICPYDKIALSFKSRGDEELREVYLIPQDQFSFENEINIYDDKVAIISHKDEIGVIIKNENIANTQRAIFNFAFQYAKLLEKDLLTEEDYAFMNKHQNRKKSDFS